MNDAVLKLKPKEETQSRECILAKESNSRVKGLMASFKQDDLEISSCDADITKCEKEIEELQSNVAKVKERNYELKNVNRAKLEEETLIGLQHFDNASAHEAEITGINDNISLTDILREVTKDHLERIKSTLLF